MEILKLSTAKSGVEITTEQKTIAEQANRLLHSGLGAGNDFLGWVNLPSSIDAEQMAAIKACAATLRAKADVVICIGIGGSYLGAKAVLDAMSNPFELLHTEHKNPIVLFAGQNISEDYTAELLEAVKGHPIATIVISKSGTTTEPAIAFRIIKEEIGEDPVVILDDVLSELDAARRKYVLSNLSSGQTIIISCEARSLVKLEKGKVFYVEKGVATEKKG